MRHLGSGTDPGRAASGMTVCATVTKGQVFAAYPSQLFGPTLRLSGVAIFDNRPPHSSRTGPLRRSPRGMHAIHTALLT